MATDLIIEATDLCKTYTTGTLTVEALRGVDFAVARGEMIAYVASLLTTYLPAWQASRIYPAEALRYE